MSDGCLIMEGFVVGFRKIVENPAARLARSQTLWAVDKQGFAEMTLLIVVVGDACMGP